MSENIVTVDSFITETRMKFCFARLCVNNENGQCRFKTVKINDDGQCKSFFLKKNKNVINN